MSNVPASDETSSSAELTRASATAGNPEAQFALAFYLSASPEPQKYDEALGWYHKAADQNHRLAQFNLGQMFAHGQGTAKCDSMALLWIRRAADGGDAGAQFNLGERFSHASLHGPEKEISESRVESYKWFHLAAAQSYRDAVIRTDFATLRMTREEVTEGNKRVRSFVTE